MLRRQLGDTIFWKGIRTYYNRFAGKNAVTGDLCNVMEEVSGKNLKPFFQQWLFTAGHPKLEISWQYIAAKKAVAVTVIQQQSPVFKFPLELQVNNKIHTADITGRETRISIPVSNKPATLIADPQVNLLYEGSVKEKK
jgi:aminopeptidase N